MLTDEASDQADDTIREWEEQERDDEEFRSEEHHRRHRLKAYREESGASQEREMVEIAEDISMSLRSSFSS